MPTRPPPFRPGPPKTLAPTPAGRPSAARRGYGRRWRALRLLVLREEPLCRDCAARDLVVPAHHVDHVTSRADGGTDDRGNLQALCHSCHSKKTQREDRKR